MTLYIPLVHYDWDDVFELPEPLPRTLGDGFLPAYPTAEEAIKRYPAAVILVFDSTTGTAHAIVPRTQKGVQA